MPVDNLACPAQLLVVYRQLNSILPATNYQLMPTTIDPGVVVSRHQQLQDIQQYYDRTAQPPTALKTGDQIDDQLSKEDNWQQVTVIAPSIQPRSYIIQTVNGHTFRCNRRILWRSTTPNPAFKDDNRTPETAPEAVLPIATKHASPLGVYATISGRMMNCPSNMNL